LILCVFDFLPLVDFICGSLCNHRLYQLLLPQRKRLLVNINEGEKISVLERLSHNRPEYFVCDVCKILHPYNGSESFALTGLQPTCQLLCFRSGKWFAPKRSIRYHVDTGCITPFFFLHLKFAMRIFRYGKKYSINMDSLTYTDIRRKTGYLLYFSREAQICPKSRTFYLRTQDMIMISYKYPYSPTIRELNNLSEAWCPLCFAGNVLVILEPVIKDFSSSQYGGMFFSYICELSNTDMEIKYLHRPQRILVIITR